MKHINFTDLENVEIEGVDARDYPDFCDAFIASADINGVALTNEELEQVQNDYPEYLNTMAYESLIP